jgi:hypothetical protein
MSENTKEEREKRRVEKLQETMRRKRKDEIRSGQASRQQTPLTDADREMIHSEMDLNAQDTALIEQLLASRRKLGRAIFNFRNPEEPELPLQEQFNTGEMDLLMMDATTLGVAKEGENGLLTIDADALAKIRGGTETTTGQAND